jgi:L-2-hydroxyglutarate oxidase LhgO
MTCSANVATTNSSNSDVVLIGAGIMSATLAVVLKNSIPG